MLRSDVDGIHAGKRSNLRVRVGVRITFGLGSCLTVQVGLVWVRAFEWRQGSLGTVISRDDRDQLGLVFTRRRAGTCLAFRGIVYVRTVVRFMDILYRRSNARFDGAALDGAV